MHDVDEASAAAACKNVSWMYIACALTLLCRSNLGCRPLSSFQDHQKASTT